MKQGDILTHPDGHTRKILGVCGEVYLLSGEDRYKIYSYGCTITEIKEQGYIIPKEQWKPKLDEEYWYVDERMIVYSDRNNNSTLDFERIDNNNCFKDKISAQLAADKIKDLLKGL